MSGDAVRVTVDPDTCASTGMCVHIASVVFDLPDRFQPAVVVAARVDDPAVIALVREAEMNCPTRAIRVEVEAR